MKCKAELMIIAYSFAFIITLSHGSDPFPCAYDSPSDFFEAHYHTFQIYFVLSDSQFGHPLL